jgi:beta-glucanase (GH16 family)
MLYLIFPLFYTSCLFSQPTDSIPVNGYQLVWADEFDNLAETKSKWNYRGLGQRDGAVLSKEAVEMNNGNLVIKVFRRNDTTFTGMVSTEHIFETKYGYFECRARFTKAPGTFPAFWLQSRTIEGINSTPEKNGAEIDIFEYYPHAYTTQVSHALHWGGYGIGHRMEGPVWGKFDPTADGFHTIGLEWTETSYATFVDGKQTYSGNRFISKVPEFLVLSLGVNQQAAGPLNSKDLPDQFTIDYVRVYKKR